MLDASVQSERCEIWSHLLFYQVSFTYSIKQEHCQCDRLPSTRNRGTCQLTSQWWSQGHDPWRQSQGQGHDPQGQDQGQGHEPQGQGQGQGQGPDIAPPFVL